MCEDPTKFTSHSDSAATAPVGYEPITELPRKEGYILTMALSSKGYSFPDSVGGAPNKAYCDYFWTPMAGSSPSYGWYGGLLCATASAGATAGFGFLNAGNRSSVAGADGGFRLCRF